MFDFINRLFADTPLASSLPSKKNKRQQGRAARIEELEPREMLNADPLSFALADVFANYSDSAAVCDLPSAVSTSAVLAAAAPAGYNTHDWNKLEAVWGAIGSEAGTLPGDINQVMWGSDVESRWQRQAGEWRLIGLYASAPGAVSVIPGNTLNLSECTYLKELWCAFNDLVVLNVSGCTSLDNLRCNGNKLTVLNVSGCGNLDSLLCHDNKLEELDVSDCVKLKTLECKNNFLTFATLPLTISDPKGYDYAPQTMKIPEFGSVVDLSSVYKIGGNTTVYVWYDSDHNLIGDSAYQNEGGIFTFSGVSEGTVVHCRMYNASFPKLDLDTNGTPDVHNDYRLKTTDIEIGPSIALPTDFRKTGQTTNTVTLSWVNPTTGDIPTTYELQYKEGTGTWVTLNSSQVTPVGGIMENATATGATVTGLTANTTYQFRLEASGNVGGNKRVADTNPVTVSTCPAAPTGFHSTGKTDTTVTLAWTAPTGTATLTYKVEKREASGGSWEVAQSGVTTTNCTVSGLKANTLYDFRLTATSSPEGGDSVPSETTSQIRTLLETPTGLTRTPPGTETAITLRWNKVTGAADYEVQYRLRSATPETPWTQWNGTVTEIGSNSLSARIEALTENGEYTFQVRAKENPAGAGNTSLWASLDVNMADDPYKLTTPTGIRLLGRTTSSLNIGWNAVPNANGGYRIEWSKDVGFANVLGSKNSSTASCEITGLAENTGYYVRITALAAPGGDYKNSSPAVSSLFTTVNGQTIRLTPPPNVRLGDSTTTTQVIAWDRVTDTATSGYRIEWATDAAFTQNLQSDIVEGGTNTTFTITGLIRGMTYYARVITTARISVEKQDSLPSDPVDFTTLEVPASAFAFYVKDRGAGKNENDVVLAWTGGVRPNGRFEYKLTDGNWITWYASSTGGTQNGEMRLFGLLAGEYQFRYVETSGSITAAAAQPKATVVKANPDALIPVKPKMPKVPADKNLATLSLTNPNAENAAKYGYNWVTLQLSQKPNDISKVAPNVVYEITYWDSKDKTKTPVGRIAVTSAQLLDGVKIEGLPKTGTSYTFDVVAKNARGENRNVANDKLNTNGTMKKEAPVLKLTLKASTAKYAAVKTVTVEKAAATVSSVKISWTASVVKDTKGYIILVYGPVEGKGKTAVTPLVHTEFVAADAAKSLYDRTIDGLKGSRKYKIQVVATTAANEGEALAFKAVIRPAYATITGNVRVEAGVNYIKPGIAWSAIKTVTAATKTYASVTKVTVGKLNAETVELSWTLPGTPAAGAKYERYIIGYQSGNTEDTIRWLPLSGSLDPKTGVVVVSGFKGAIFDRSLLTEVGINLASTKKCNFVVRAVILEGGSIVNQSLDAKFVITPSKLQATSLI